MIDVCMIADDNYVLPTMSAVKSIADTTNENVFVHILSNNIEGYGKSLILKLQTKKCKIEILEVNDRIPNIECEHEYVTKTALAKFLIPDIFNNLDKILYLDVDVIVKKDLSKLFNTNIESLYAGAVRDIEDSKMGFGKKLGLNVYFNSGVMLLNLKQLREDNISEKLVNYKKYDESTTFMDQNAFNYIFAEKIKLLPFNFNYMVPNINEYSDNQIIEFWGISKEELNDYRHNITILHLTNRLKPWDSVSSPSLGIYLPYLMSLRPWKLVFPVLAKMYKQNPKRLIKYCFLYCILRKGRNFEG